MSSIQPIAVVLFSGGGGVECGLVEAGVTPVVAIEFDPTKPQLSKAIADCHEFNFPDCKVVRQTVQEVAAAGFLGFPQELDILWASPVCSNFSQAKLGGLEQPEDIEAAKAVCQAIKQLQPQYFLLENVPKYADSDSWLAIENCLYQQGYSVQLSVEDLSDYGVPQARKRLIVRASRVGEPMQLPPVQAKVSWYEAIADLIPGLPDSALVSGQQKSLEKWLSSNESTPLLIDRVGGRGEYKVKPSHLPCNTIIRSFFTDGKGSNRSRFADIWLPGSSTKQVTIECVRRLQSFPDWYQLPESIAVAGSILGYSVPPKFVTLMLRQWQHKEELAEVKEIVKELGWENATPTTEHEFCSEGIIHQVDANHALKVQTSSKSDEQWTPDTVIEAAISVLGQIDLDPCSNSRECPNVPASQHYTIADDGLLQTWGGRVWLNPPYSNTAQWVDKVLTEYSEKRVTETIVLVKSATDTQWYQRLDDYPCCHWNGRLKFKNPDNKGNTAPFASTLFYLGENYSRFKEVFSQYGRVKPGQKLVGEMEESLQRRSCGSLSWVSPGKRKDDTPYPERALYSYSVKEAGRWKTKKLHVPTGKVEAVKEAIAAKRGYKHVVEEVLGKLPFTK